MSSSSLSLQEAKAFNKTSNYGGYDENGMVGENVQLFALTDTMKLIKENCICSKNREPMRSFILLLSYRNVVASCM